MPDHQGPVEITPRGRSTPSRQGEAESPNGAGDDVESDLPPGRRYLPGRPTDVAVRGDRTRRTLIGLVAALALTAAVVMVVNGPGGGSSSGEPSPPTTIARSGSTMSRSTVPASTTISTMPPPDRSVVAIGSPIPDVAAVTDLEIPSWTEWTIPVPDAAARLSVPTEVVALTSDGTLHRIEFPSGRVRSISIERLGAQPELALTQDAIAVMKSNSTLLLSDDRPARELAISDRGLDTITARTSDFVISGRQVAFDDPEMFWLLDTDGTLVDVTDGPLADVALWDRSSLPSDEWLATRPGGVYAITDDGAARRLSEGLLLASGVGHIAVERCDEELPCTDVLIDLATGDESPASLGVLDDYRYWDTSTHISPDGRSIHFADWLPVRGVWRIADVASGAAIDLGAIRQIRSADTWAADSSGVFAAAGPLLTFDAIDGTAAAISGMGEIIAIATRPATP